MLADIGFTIKRHCGGRLCQLDERGLADCACVIMKNAGVTEEVCLCDYEKMQK